MTIKLVSAYHEAGHIVVAKCSKFHDIIGDLDLELYGAGGVNVSLSKSKLQDAGKRVDLSSQTHKDVTKDFALVLMAGYAAEEIAATKNSEIIPIRECAALDYNQLSLALRLAGLSKKTDFAEVATKDILIKNWDLVEAIASSAYKKGGLSNLEIKSFFRK